MNRFRTVLRPIIQSLIETTPTPLLRFFLIAPLIGILLMILCLVIYFPSLPPLVPLYYSKPWGEEQLTNPHFLYVLPLGIFLWYCTTLLFIHYRLKQYLIFARIVIAAQACVTLFACIVLINILLLMT